MSIYGVGLLRGVCILRLYEYFPLELYLRYEHQPLFNAHALQSTVLPLNPLPQCLKTTSVVHLL